MTIPNHKVVMFWTVITIINMTVGIGVTTVLLLAGIHEHFSKPAFVILAQTTEREHARIDADISNIQSQIGSIDSRLQRIENLTAGKDSSND